MYKSFFKRIIDFTLSLTGVIIISPIFVIITVILFFTNNGKPFFFQSRPTCNERIFRVMKFKTMNDKRDRNGTLLPDAKRMTKIGKFIRSTSLDEIPQLLNVIKGDMSLIGPRPLLMEYLPLYNAEQKRRHEVRPGVTGWAQVNGRNTISWKKKFEHDVWYVDNLSFGLDLKILFLTIKKVLIREGVNAETDITMEKFTGNN
ncbi:MAG: sugar transferase [Bacteroidales bacterium]|nr:sugar transferase [Bacteroidales bacterium]